ncbi:MAG: transposase family protein, partial [Planctomycetaceae bacterium]|nr:transposase family protein [Planctomycetaceae bacterium]
MDVLKVCRSRYGNAYLLVIVDTLSKFVMACPMANEQAETVGAALVRCLMDSGVGFPERILSDNGPAFTSQLMAEMAATFGYKHSFTTAFHPAADGQTERMNRTLLAMLAKVCIENPLMWEDHLSWVLMGYNATPHSTTKFAPFQLLFGRNPNLPSEEVLSTARSPYTVDPLSWWDTLARQLPMSWQTAKLRIQEMNLSNKKYFDRKIHPYSIKSGDWVMWCD